eukprot:475533_1
MTHKYNDNDSNTPQTNNNNNNNNTIPIVPSQILSLNMPIQKKKTMKSRRLRARIHQQSSSQSYSEHLRITRNHNHNFKKMTQKIKERSRNDSCPPIKPLSIEEKQLIITTVKSNSKLSNAINLGKEIDDGHIEFKWKLISPAPDRLQHLITQMTYRLGEGCGKCIYQIGIEDNGHPKGLSDTELIQSISTIFLMGKQLNANVTIRNIQLGIEGKVATLYVKQLKIMSNNGNDVEDNCIRVCVTGNESVGKSTLIGVLTRGKLDDGNGSARMNVFRHRHEIFDGRTSSISHHILGFDKNGIITNYKPFQIFNGSHYKEIVKSSTKLITFVDHPGHERYFKTSVFGLTSHKPHYVLLTVSLDEFYSNKNKKNNDSEWTQMLSLNLDGLLDGNSTDSDDISDSDNDNDISNDIKLDKHENILPEKSNDPSNDYHKYLTLCESINVPLFIVITKSDIDCEYNYKLLPKMFSKISAVIKKKTHGKLKVKLIETSSEAQRAARALGSSVISYIPVIVSSCVNGEGLQILKTFLFSLSASKQNNNNDNNNHNVEFGIDDIYYVDNVGIVTSGIVRNGIIHVNDELCIGPNKLGTYKTVTIKSIHVRRKDVSYTFSGQMASVCLSEINSKNEIRRGMVLLNKNINKHLNTCYSFEAHIDVLNNMSLRENSQPIIHIENIRQSAHILHLHSNDNIINTLSEGQNGVAVFTFLHYPEYITCGMKVIIRKSHGPIAIGIVTKILDSCDKPLVPLNSLQKPHRLRTSKSKTNFKHYLLKWNLEKKNKQKKK